jgi:nucleotide-binding universal stress UspA family protein
MLQFQSIPRSVHAFNRISHPTDFTVASGNGLAWAIHLAKQYQAELLLLHVLALPVPIFEIEPPMKSEAEIALSILLARLETSQIKARGFLLTGKTSIDRQIVRAARAEQADLIIMGTRGRTGLSRFLAGSIASRVIARAHCPVLIVPGQ